MIGVLSWVKSKMTIGLAVLVFIMAGLLLASHGANQRLSDSNVVLDVKLTEIVTTLADHTLQFQNLNVAMTGLAETQEQLDTSSRELQTFISEISNDQDRDSDPFWDAFFERLRDDDATAGDQQPATVP